MGKCSAILAATRAPMEKPDHIRPLEAEVPQQVVCVLRHQAGVVEGGS